VTLDGTIIHKSGLITGGRSTHDSGKKWEEKDIQGKFSRLTIALHGTY
jgi:structural maintenance of chromosome 1